MKRHLRSSVILVLLLFSACAKTPPTVTTPQGITAFQNLQIYKTLDLIRDIAIDANDTEPPILRTDVTRKVVSWHKSALTLIHARAEGWRAVILNGLDGILRTMSDDERSVFSPYVALLKTIVESV